MDKRMVQEYGIHNQALAKTVDHNIEADYVLRLLSETEPADTYYAQHLLKKAIHEASCVRLSHWTTDTYVQYKDHREPNDQAAVRDIQPPTLSFDASLTLVTCNPRYT